MRNPIQYCRYFSARKIINLSKAGLSFAVNRIFRKHPSFRNHYAVSIETTAVCNLQCPACTLGSGELLRDNRYMDYEVFKRIVDELRPNIINANLYFQGEPLMHPEIENLISYAEKNRIHTTISTNGGLLSLKASRIASAGLSRLIVSVDGITPDTYERYRVNGDFSVLCEGLNSLMNLKKTYKKFTTVTEAQFIVMRHNEHEIHDFFIWAKKIGFDRAHLKSLQVNRHKDVELVPAKSCYARYKVDESGNLQIKSGLKNACYRLLSTVVITVDGDVVPCCFDKNAKYSFGNINQRSINEILASEKAKDFRKKVFNDRKSVDICLNCTEGLNIRY
ncbi:MAG: SPASM domain-containing protein [Bacteroidales bacterium]|nr:SPASM domain-containing protein [Bacteroidales bacterium]HOY39030.1 radical SAM protein [Bacteroidales bacterium]HQP04124.1 radical SAM protein [Bacteroidales bacterium]